MSRRTGRTIEVRRRGGREPRHSVESIVQAALELIDDEGFQVFSMRRLAEKIGVGPMTIYGYVKTKEEVLDLVVGRALQGVLDDLDRAAPWHEQIAVAVNDLHDALREHPGVLEILLAKPTPSRQLDLIRETLLRVLIGAGFDRRQAWEAVGCVASYAIGFATSQGSFGGEDTVPERVRRLKSLPAAEFPHLAQLADDYPAHMSNRAFERGLGHLLAGLRKDLSKKG